MTGGYRDFYVSGGDGLKLYARDYGPAASDALPVVCLPGIARHSEDFHALASALAADPRRPRRVLAPDYRGRGRSEWDKDWRRYDVRVELDDVIQTLVAAGIPRAVFVGTSRGGIIAMGLGALRPAVLAGVVLNDIGPAIDAKGLMRIRGYVGKLPTPRSLTEGGQILKQIMDAQFPRFTAQQWEGLARGMWKETDGGLVLAYDPQLMRTLEAFDPETPLPDLWPLFEGLKRVPTMVLRGANSDILSPATVKRMKSLHPRLEAVTVADQGHAPVLEGDLIPRIKRFVEMVEAA
ncbi:MAG TPA: alpha/beta hydrolase [Microvirga sp.]|jgi:pimeloyl-ACP methyl ester carboxylesterase|nr:alpha/beta hydrolase [Microvirga sp.]